MDLATLPVTYGLEGPVLKSRQQCRLFKTALKKTYAHWEFRGWERDELECVLGFKAATEALLASNLKLRHAAVGILAGLLAELRVESLAIPSRRFWHGSFLGPLVNEREPNLECVLAFKSNVDRLIRDAGLNAIVATEFQALTNYPQRRRGCSFLTNAHAVVWTDDPEFDVDKAVAKMRASKRLKSELGADTVVFKPRDLTPGQLEYLAYYLLKAPLAGKYRARDPKNSSRWALNPTEVRPALLLRLSELQSHFELPDLVWGIGEGGPIRSLWKQDLFVRNSLSRARIRQPLEQDFDVAALWNGIRARPGNGSRLYLPVIFQARRPQR